MRISVPDHSIAVIMPIEKAQELYHLCVMIRKTKRLQVDKPIHDIAGELALAILASEEIMVLPKGREND